MRRANIESMKGGWFVGAFSPTVLHLTGAEVAIKRYKAGDKEDWHVHRIATEVTAVVSGTIQMNKEYFETGEIVLLNPGEGSDFQAITDAVIVAVKAPSVAGDKYAAAPSLEDSKG